jgi:hypothetical protein
MKGGQCGSRRKNVREGEKEMLGEKVKEEKKEHCGRESGGGKERGFEEEKEEKAAEVEEEIQGRMVRGVEGRKGRRERK